MPKTKTTAMFWLMLVLLAGVTRIPGAFLLPNAFGDAYVYIRDIGTLSTKLAAGSFRITDLFGFWLPLYQFISATLNIFVHNGFYSGKIVSAVCGVGACLFVYAITLLLTGDRRAAFITFLLIALNPLHIFYSTSAMTDVPHAFLVLATLYFVLKQNWVIAALFAALAGLTRVESWMFIVIIPFLQLVRERRVSLLGIIIMTLPPLFWLYVSWKATGNALACFQQRQQYLDWLLTMNPTIAHFSLRNVARDLAILLISSELLVLIACFAAGWLIVRHLRRWTMANEMQMIFPVVTFFFVFLALLLVAYMTHQQPIIFPRYGLILFTIGLPVLTWAMVRAHQQNGPLFRRLLIAGVVVCSLEYGVQFAGAVGTIKQYRAQRRAAEYLQNHFDRNSDARIFCDEGTVQVLSGIPFERFVTSSEAPRDREGFLALMRKRNVKYLVVARQPGSTPQILFPELKSGTGADRFVPLYVSQTTFLPTEIWIYEVSRALSQEHRVYRTRHFDLLDDLSRVKFPILVGLSLTV